MRRWKTYSARCSKRCCKERWNIISVMKVTMKQLRKRRTGEMATGTRKLKLALGNWISKFREIEMDLLNHRLFQNEKKMFQKLKEKYWQRMPEEWARETSQKQSRIFMALKCRMNGIDDHRYDLAWNGRKEKRTSTEVLCLSLRRLPGCDTA